MKENEWIVLLVKYAELLRKEWQERNRSENEKPETYENTMEK